LADAAAVGRAPDEGDALTSFWPVPVTGLIRSHQARLTTEMRNGPAGPGALPEPGGPGRCAPATAPGCGPSPPAIRSSRGSRWPAAPSTPATTARCSRCAPATEPGCGPFATGGMVQSAIAVAGDAV